MKKFDDLYSSIIFIDSMVVLEGRPLDEQPWREIDADGPILLLLVPQVCKEIDKRKRDGRLGKHARAFNRLITPAAESGRPQPIVTSKPRVDLALAITSRVDWDNLYDLDPEEADARVIAQVIHERDVPTNNKVFFSQDINPIGMASRHGITTKKMPEHWVRSPEPSPQQKELTRLKDKVLRLEANEPVLEVSMDFDAKQPFRHPSTVKLSKQEKNQLMRRIIEEHPKIPQGHRGIGIVGMSLHFDSSYDGKYENWIRTVVPKFVNSIQDDIPIMYSQSAITLEIQNTGHIQAEDLILRLEVSNGTISKKWIVTPSFPFAPRPERVSVLSNFNHNAINRTSLRVGRHEMVYAIKANGGSTVEVHCQDFRHGRVWKMDAALAADTNTNNSVKLIVVATASNMRGEKRFHFSFEHEPNEVLLSDIYDIQTLEFLKERPMEIELDRAMKEVDFSRLSTIKYSKD